MAGDSSNRRFLHEWLMPFRGTWHLPWIVHRYFQSARCAFTPSRTINAIRALAAMKMGLCRVKSQPFVLRIEPCNICDLQCPLCACGNRTDPRPKGFMTMADYEHIINLHKRTAIIVRLDGMGEPTLHPELFDMVRLAKSHGLSVTVHSNFNPDTCDNVEQFLDCGLDRLVIGLDGVTQESYGKYRVGGNFELVVDRMKRLIAARKKRRMKRPIIEVQLIDFDFNRDEQSEMRRLVRQWGADVFTIVAPDYTTKQATVDPARPKRCIWLWCVMTVGWNLDYRSCANAWSLPWPRLNLRYVGPRQWWNHELMVEARGFNNDRSSQVIADDTDCKCNRCYEMLVVPLVDNYKCE